MIDFYNPVDFAQTVYTIDDTGTVKAHTLADLCRQHCDETTTPHGIAPKMHTRGNELWTWGLCGNFPELVATFDTDAEAEHALMLCHLFDLEHNFSFFYRLADAESHADDFKKYSEE